MIRKSNILVENHFTWAAIFIITISALLLARLWFVQVYKGEYYRKVSERNRIRRIEIPAPRGVIFDRHGQVVLGNRPFFDLVFIPQFIQDRDNTLKILSRLLHVPVRSLERRLRIGGGRPKYLPITLKRNLSIHEVAVVQSNKVFLPGIDVVVAPRRDYQSNVPPHLVGYLGEIDQATLKRKNEEAPDSAYQPGDLIGKQGLESAWEEQLRGTRGYRIIQVDAFGRQTLENELAENLPEMEAKPGNNLELTLDWDLQQATREAFQGKYGAVVVMNPKNGEILSILSSPGFDPTAYQEGMTREEWLTLLHNPFKPLYDKATGGEYPPGSVYKAVVAIAGIEEGFIKPNTKIHCPGSYVLGDQTFKCWEHGGHGLVGLKRAMMRSCDVYFYEIGVQLGVDKIAQYARQLGLGRRLGLKLNTDKAGLVPTSAWKQLVHRLPWTAGDTPNIAIGQGYNLMTPVQMASLYATIGNGGKVFKPQLVRKITNPVGEVILEQKPELIQKVQNIKPATLKLVAKHLQEVVMDQDGTGKKAAVEGHTVAGKTGSVQVVSLKKNRNQDDVSMKWKEHAMFAAFSPTTNPEIAVSVISENDRIGGGGAAAAPVAGAIIKAYYELKERRQQKLKVSTLPQEVSRERQ